MLKEHLTIIKSSYNKINDNLSQKVIDVIYLKIEQRSTIETLKLH